MGCAGSKNLPSDPATDDQPEKPQPQPDEPVGCKDVVLDTQPAPILPPAPPTPCETYRDDANATPCLDCPPGWLTRTATEGEKNGCTYYFCSELCVSQWDAPSGAPKPSAELTCTCGCLKSAHKVCAEWNPRPDTKPLTCNCGFLKEDHRPCHTYRVNMSAANFGECKCGFAKDVHDADAFASGGKAKRQDRTSKELRDGFAHKEYADCPNYTVNLQSANFGECKCGRPKGEHSPEALAKNAEAGQMSGTTRRDSSEVRSHFVHKEKVDCKKYEPDLTGGEMGVCKCGAKRGDHSDFALSADTGRHTAKQGALHVVAQKEYADCPHFELNMDPAAPFGTCRCGRSRVDHSEAALAADGAPHHAIRKNSCEVRREMEAKQEQIGTTVETHGAKVGPQAHGSVSSRYRYREARVPGTLHP
ncbi:hypothetical protein AB1Y20_011649 [Prymnesium parvum]|uniref:WW domain-containing protein n=1 Tax=Prymnesium parvum TaxID=97485 RepID=A0AB34IJQ7_PRYPA